jgi:hypothetical protein
MAGSGKRAVIAIGLFKQQRRLGRKRRGGTNDYQYPQENKQLDYSWQQTHPAHILLKPHSGEMVSAAFEKTLVIFERPGRTGIVRSG